MAWMSQEGRILLLVLLDAASAENFRFILDIENRLDPSWRYSSHKVGTRIQCASMCYRETDHRCSYFGYKNHECHLIDALNREECSVEDCIDNGMKIYKMNVEKPETTTTTTTTIEPTTKAETTVMIETTTTTVVPTTTTTEITTTTTKGTTSTTESPTTTTPPTTKGTTSTTEGTTITTEGTTSTTEGATTTTEGTTTTTEGATTTTEDPTTTTEGTTTTTEGSTSTTEGSASTTEGTTTTTEGTTSTTEGTTTTTEGTTSTTMVTSTTTESGFVCEPPNGAEAEVKCPQASFLLNVLGSQFFSQQKETVADISATVISISHEDFRAIFGESGGLPCQFTCRSFSLCDIPIQTEREKMKFRIDAAWPDKICRIVKIFGRGGVHPLTCLCWYNKCMFYFNRRSPFYRDVLAPSCSRFKDMLVSEKDEELIFFSVDGGLTINAYCVADDYVIYEFKWCVIDNRVVAIILHCRKLLDPGIVKRTLNATSDDAHVLVDCGSKTALQKMFLEDAGKTITRTIFQCLELDADELVEVDTGDAKNAVG
ncbi:uncharacterized protein [Parasteatoda tepidariorum]|uniref:uncharacterized protein n=1 Tax=Parasteatoda tepidariorum TaxID=114398 RepID=UPI0039BC439E